MVFTKKIILASGSPRRHELLGIAGVPHTILTAPADEKSIKFIPGHPSEYVISIAKLKNDAVFAKIMSDRALFTPCVIISADTVVYHPDCPMPLGKPKDRDDAISMLRVLSGSCHTVVTGVVLRDTDSGRESSFSSVTEVVFRPLGEQEIIDYIDSGDPFDKAGGYGIQGAASVFVRSISGDYFNIMGLPVCRVYEELIKLL